MNKTIITVRLKLVTNPHESRDLYEIMKMFNDACRCVSKLALKHEITYPKDLYHLDMDGESLYTFLRKKYPKLCSAHIQLVFRRVIKSHKFDKYVFNDTSPILYNQLMINYKCFDMIGTDEQYISVRGINERSYLEYKVGQHYVDLIKNKTGRIGEIVLVYDKSFYLFVPIEIYVSEPSRSKKMIPIFINSDIYDDKKKCDIFNKMITSKSDDENVRLTIKEKRRQSSLNHILSKRIVEQALKEEARIVTTIFEYNERNRQLAYYINYKGILAGIDVRMNRSQNATRRCSKCGFINEQIGESFKCEECGYTDSIINNISNNLQHMRIPDKEGKYNFKH